eukprot:752751-Prymnesium_polylepis.1
MYTSRLSCAESREEYHASQLSPLSLAVTHPPPPPAAGGATALTTRHPLSTGEVGQITHHS